MILGETHKVSTNGRHGNSLEFSPHSPNLLAVVANDNFGITGSGELAVVSVSFTNDSSTGISGPSFSGRASVFPHSDAQCCLAWSSHVPQRIVTGGRSGRLALWDVANLQDDALVQDYIGPRREASCVAWSEKSAPPHFIAGSWDGSLHLFDPNLSQAVSVITPLPGIVNDVRWAPHTPDTFAAALGDGTVRLYQRCLSGLVVPAHPGCDALSCDWCPSQPHLLATAGSDAAVCVWDLRSAHQPFMVMQGHEKAVNRVRFSPHVASTLATASYDFTTRVWQGSDTMLSSNCHGGFSFSVAWNPVMAGVLADCSWDGTMALYVV